MRKLIICLLLMLSVSGCKEEVVETMNVLYEDKGNYTYVIPFESTDTRNYHSTYQSRFDTTEIGVGLEEYSKNYFDTDSYYAQEGQIITRKLLTSFVARESDSNPQGLNPAKESAIEVIDGVEMLDSVIVTDVMELDFIDKKDTSFKTSAMTLAIVVNQDLVGIVNNKEESYTMDDDLLWEYASNAGRKLESYLRTLDSVQDLPILILIYNTTSSDSMLPGGFIGYGYFSGRTGQFSKISDKWVLLPTNESKKLDPTTNNEILEFKSSLKEYLPESISIIGQAQYENEKMSYLRITVSVQAKTYAEVKSLTQYCALLSSDFTSNDARLVIHIKSNDETFAIVQRTNGSSEVEISYIY